MKINLSNDNITITPKPKEDIPNGLCVSVVKMGQEDIINISPETYFTDIIKGQSLYEKPYGYKVLKAWINEKPRTIIKIPKSV